MANYKEIQKYVKEKYGYVPKSCWIAHMKEVTGQSVRVAYNRQDIKKRKYPCPSEKMESIKSAFVHFEMIKL